MTITCAICHINGTNVYFVRTQQIKKINPVTFITSNFPSQFNMNQG